MQAASSVIGDITATVGLLEVMPILSSALFFLDLYMDVNLCMLTRYFQCMSIWVVLSASTCLSIFSCVVVCACVRV